MRRNPANQDALYYQHGCRFVLVLPDGSVKYAKTLAGAEAAAQAQGAALYSLTDTEGRTTRASTAKPAVRQSPVRQSPVRQSPVYQSPVRQSPVRQAPGPSPATPDPFAGFKMSQGILDDYVHAWGTLLSGDGALTENSRSAAKAFIEAVGADLGGLGEAEWNDKLSQGRHGGQWGPGYTLLAPKRGLRVDVLAGGGIGPIMYRGCTVDDPENAEGARWQDKIRVPRDLAEYRTFLRQCRHQMRVYGQRGSGPQLTPAQATKLAALEAQAQAQNTPEKTLQGKALPEAALRRAFTFTSKDEARPSLNCVLIERLGGNKYRFVATDGYRICKIELQTKDIQWGAKAPDSVLAPRFVLKALKAGKPFAVSNTGGLAGEPNEPGDFPAYERVFPDVAELNKFRLLDGAELHEMGESVKALADATLEQKATKSADSVLVVDAGGEYIRFRPTGWDIGGQQLSRDPVGLSEIGLDLRWVLQTVEKSVAVLRFSDEVGPSWVERDRTNWHETHVIMPIRLDLSGGY